MGTEIVGTLTHADAPHSALHALRTLRMRANPACAFPRDTKNALRVKSDECNKYYIDISFKSISHVVLRIT
jgi:hypothetical protein